MNQSLVLGPASLTLAAFPATSARISAGIDVTAGPWLGKPCRCSEHSRCSQ